jgi:hypothetical protein
MSIELTSIEFSQQGWSDDALETNNPQYALYIDYLYFLFCACCDILGFYASYLNMIYCIAYDFLF